MLKDIKNVMSTKRTNSESSPMSASLLNVITGDSYEIPTHKSFIIGRSLTSSIVIEQIYISRCHCIINHNNGQFTIYDNGTSSGTFINFNKIPKGKNHLTVLNHGDLIGFGDKRNLDVVFKFSLFSVAEKRPRLEQQKEDFSDKINKLNENYKNSLKKLHAEVLDLKVEKLVLHNKTETHISEFNLLLKSASDYISQLGTEIANNKLLHQDLIKQISVYKDTLILQQECLDKKNSQGPSIEVESFKKEMYNILENDFQCPICNEVIIKACVANCHHSFCASCINQWLSKSKICPICRTPVKTTTNCLVMDNFITNLCNAIGGTVKEQRDNLQKERIVVPVPMARRGRKRPTNRRQNPEFDILLSDLMRYNPHVEIVDLTNTSR